MYPDSDASIFLQLKTAYFWQQQIKHAFLYEVIIGSFLFDTVGEICFRIFYKNFRREARK